MRYVLKNKDKEVLRFKVSEIEVAAVGVDDGLTMTKEIISDTRIIDINMIPINFKRDVPLSDSIMSWIQKRKVPRNRENVARILATSGNEKLMDYVNVSLALSLNDSFWIAPARKNYQWKEVNLYDNELNEKLALVAFGIKSPSKVKGITLSPEYTTNGMLKKCWQRDNGKIYLYKGSSEEYANGGKEAFSEYYTAQIAEVMEFNHISYDLKKGSIKA